MMGLNAWDWINAGGSPVVNSIGLPRGSIRPYRVKFIEGNTNGKAIRIIKVKFR